MSPDPAFGISLTSINQIRVTDARVSAPISAETPYAGTAMQSLSCDGPYSWHPTVTRSAAPCLYPRVLKRNDTDPAFGGTQVGQTSSSAASLHDDRGLFQWLGANCPMRGTSPHGPEV